MSELVKPAFNTRSYDTNKVVRIADRWQSFLYIKHGAYPVDMYVSTDENLVMVFDKEETRELYEKYRRYELK